MRARGIVGCLWIVAACSYDFGGTDAGTGAADTTSSSSGEVASTSDVTSTTGTESATVASATSASSVEASSSSTGVVDMVPCKVAGTDQDFVDAFDDAEAEDRWTWSPDETSAQVDPNTGSVRLWLGVHEKVELISKATVDFHDCYVDVEQTNVSSHQYDVVGLYWDDRRYFTIGFLSEDVDPGTVVELRWGMGTNMVATETHPNLRAPYVRLAAEGSKARAYIREPGEGWQLMFEGERQPWMNDPLVLALGLHRRDTREGQVDLTAGVNFDNVNNLP